MGTTSVTNRIVPPDARRRLRSGVIVGLSALMTLTICGAALHHPGQKALDLQLNGGTAWFSDSSNGYAALFDGATSSRVTDEAVRQPGDHILVAESDRQSGSGGYVVDQTAGTVTHLDGATFQASTVTASDADDSQLDVLSNSKATWVITRHASMIYMADPQSLQPLSAAQAILAAAYPVELANGTLWVASRNGVVRSFAGGESHASVRPADQVRRARRCRRPPCRH